MHTKSNGVKKRILVVDDIPRNTHLMKLYLEQTEEYVVKEENNSSAAVASAEEFLPDLILLDVMMPDVDGGELAARFATHAKLSRVPIVFLTAAITKDEIKNSVAERGFTFLAKPVVLAEVAAVLKKRLAA